MTRPTMTAAALVARWLLDGEFHPADLAAVGRARADQATQLTAAERAVLLDLLSNPPPKAGLIRQKGVPKWHH